MKPVRALAIGMDGADWRLVDEWCASGHLPNLARLRERGHSGVLASPPGHGDDGCWASFYTGVAPGRHGRYMFESLHPGAYDWAFHQDADLRHEPVWNVLSRQGYRIAVLDVPKSPRMSPELNGVGLSDWRVHGPDHHGPTSVPASLATDLLARWGADETDTYGPIYWCKELPMADLQNFVACLSRSVQQKHQVNLEVLRQGGWDLMLTVFKETHCAGHMLWHLHNEPLRDIYQAIDAAIGQLVEEAGPEASVMVFSVLGLGANHTIYGVLDDILWRWELSTASLYRKLRLHSLPFRHGKPPRRIRQFYEVPSTDLAGAIRFNVKGRDRRGQIAPQDLTEVYQGLERMLTGLVNASTGRKVVARVIRSDGAFPGPHRDQLPDIFVEWTLEERVDTLVLPGLGTFRNQAETRSGGHRRDGFFISTSHEFAPMGTILDLAPTLAAWLGTTLPDVDGQTRRLETLTTNQPTSRMLE